MPDEELKRTRDSERTRAAIMDAARELFVAHGYARTSVRAVAREAGVTHGTLYLYFRDKDDLLQQLAEEYGRALLATLRAIPRTLDPAERVRAILRAVAAYAVEQPSHYRLIVAAAASEAATADPLAGDGRRTLEDALARAAARGRLVSADPALDAGILLAALRGAIDDVHAAGLAPDEALRRIDRLLELLLDGLAWPARRGDDTRESTSPP